MDKIQNEIIFSTLSFLNNRKKRKDKKINSNELLNQKNLDDSCNQIHPFKNTFLFQFLIDYFYLVEFSISMIHIQRIITRKEYSIILRISKVFT